MGKGPTIKREIRFEIAFLWKNGTRTGTGILKALQERDKNDKASASLPKLRTVQAIIKKIEDKNKAKEQKEQDVDSAWCLGVCEKHGIPPEATNDLLHVWWWCTLTGRQFTVREAKWVARLRDVYPWPNFFYSGLVRQYAAREWAADILGEPIDTSDLDALLVAAIEPRPEVKRGIMWACATAVATGAVRRHDLTDEERAQLESPEANFTLQPDIAAEFLLWKMRFDEVKIKPLPPVANVVYALWIRKIVNAEVWRTLAIEKQVEIIERLQDMIIEEAERQQQIPYSGYGPVWEPIEILKKLGIGDYANPTAQE